jgi:hypothetical protein
MHFKFRPGPAVDPTAGRRGAERRPEDLNGLVENLNGLVEKL